MFDDLIDRLQNRRTLILGIGNPLRGDDGLGPALIKPLQGKVGAVLIDAGDAPENHLFVIAEANPQAIVIVDTARLGSQPGEVAIAAMSSKNRIGRFRNIDGWATFSTLSIVIVDLLPYHGSRSRAASVPSAPPAGV